MVIDCKEFILREPNPGDVSDMTLLANNRNIWLNLRNHFPHPYDEGHARQFILSCMKKPIQTIFAIEMEYKIIGVIGLFIQEDVYSKSAELGYWLGEPFWNKGIMSKAIPAIRDFGLNALNLERIHAGVYEYNEASMRVLEKSGFVKEGIARNAVVKNNRLVNEHIYSILKSDVVPCAKKEKASKLQKQVLTMN